jgi:hypothetical protein
MWFRFPGHALQNPRLANDVRPYVPRVSQNRIMAHQKDEYNQLEWNPKNQRFAQNWTLFMACSGGTHGQIMGYERGKRSRGPEN